MKEKVTIFCQARSGSCLVSQAITYYHYRKYPNLKNFSPLCLAHNDDSEVNPANFVKYYRGAEYLCNIYFNGLSKFEIDDKGIKRTTTPFQVPNRVEYLSRRDALSKVHDLGYYPLVKNISSLVEDDTYDFFKSSGHKVLFLKRRDVSSQLLSRLIGMRTYFHQNAKTNYKQECEPFVVKRSEVEAFFDRYDHLEALIQPDDIVLYYEDFVYNIDLIYKSLEINDYKDYVTGKEFLTTKKIENDNKLKFVKNQEEYLSILKEFTDARGITC